MQLSVGSAYTSGYANSFSSTPVDDYDFDLPGLEDIDAILGEEFADLPDFDVFSVPVGLGEDSAWGYSMDWSLTLGEYQYGDVGAIVTNLSHQEVTFQVTGHIVGTDITDYATGTLSQYGDQAFSELFDEVGPIQGPGTVEINVRNLTPESQIFAGVGGVQIFGN
jgi:hypothetical protein